jgi:mono/diheme cytochrome c family protein
MRRRQVRGGVARFGVGVLSLGAAALATPGVAQTLWPEVSAILTERCIACHQGEYAPLGLSLDSHAGLMAGSENGPVVLTGDVAASPLLRRLRGEAQPQMPLDGPPFLEPEQIALFEAWIAAGAMMDGDAVPQGEEPVADDGLVTWSDVDAILKQRCIVCHSDNGRMEAPPEDLRLTGLAEVLAGGDRVVVVPGNPEASEIWRRVVGHADPRMPFDGPPWLAEDQIALIYQWIAEGAVDDAGVPAPVPVGAEVRLRGRVTGPNQIDGAGFTVTGGTRVEDALSEGMQAEVRAVIAPDGGLTATRLRAR